MTDAPRRYAPTQFPRYHTAALMMRRPWSGFGIAIFLQLAYNYFVMTPLAWLKARAVELGAAACTAGVLIAGLAIGVPFLRARIPEVFLYGFCCISAVILRAVIDLAVRSVVFATHRVAPNGIVIPVISRYPAGVVR